MRKILIPAIPTLMLCYPSVAYLQQSSPEAAKQVTFIAKIDKIDPGKTAMDSDMRLLMADRFYFKTKTPCDKNTLSGRPESFGLTPEAYVEKIRSLMGAILDERSLFLTLDSCEGGKTPMLTNIEVCTESLCGAEAMKRPPYIWLNDNLRRTVKRQATSAINQPLVFDKEKQLWKVTGWYIESDKETEDLVPGKQMAFEGYTDDEQFKEQKFVSTFTSYYSSGRTQHVTNYNQAGEQDGKYESYYDESGKLVETVTFKNGLVNGEYITYHENGAIESKRHFIDNQIVDGPCPHYYDDGTLKEDHHYLNGQLDGMAYEYFPNGKIKDEVKYLNGKTVGKHSVYYDSGKIRATYNKNEQNQYDGVNEEYSKEGKLLATATYKEGKQLASQSWYQNGNMREEVLFDSEGRKDGLSREWYENGQLSQSRHYKQDQLDGDTHKWNEDGKPLSLSPYRNGELNGETKHWNTLGKLDYTTTYLNGKQHGPDRRWSVKTGKLIEEIPYVNGVRNGIKKQFNDRTGKVTSATPYVDGSIQGTEETYDADGISAIHCYQDDKMLDTLYTPLDTRHKAEQGDARAQYQLGKYDYGCQNYATGIAWLEKSAAQNDIYAIMLLTEAYGEGIGVAPDQEKYFAYLLQAAELGDADMQLSVAYSYLVGEGVAKNLAESYKWHMKSAEQGNLQANFNLGWMYGNGQGVEKDHDQAIRYFTVAAEGGMQAAIEILQQLESNDK